MIHQIVEVADSTICASAASWLSLRGPLDAKTLHHELDVQGFAVSFEALLEALADGAQRGRITINGPLYASTLPAGHVVTSRSDADPTGWTWQTTAHSRRSAS